MTSAGCQEKWRITIETSQAEWTNNKFPLTIRGNRENRKRRIEAESYKKKISH